MEQSGLYEKVYLGLGTNLGDRWRNLSVAVDLLQEQVRLSDLSSVYETEPAYVTEQPRFLNMVCRGETALMPYELLSFVKNLEQRIGRQPSQRFGPRLIDIDILFYADMIINMPDLVLPHPRFAERAFVLVPLSEIAGEFIPPGLTMPVAQLLPLSAAHGGVVRKLGGLAEDIAKKENI